MNVNGPFNDIVDVAHVTNNGMTNLKTAKYQGSAYSDAQYALYKLSSSWSMLSHTAFTDDVAAWIGEGKSLIKEETKITCNNDIMLQTTKGVFGLRIDNVDTFNIDNVQIEDLQNIGYYGSWICGHYASKNDGGHSMQRAPIQYGYTGTEIHGLSVINSKGAIDNLSIRKIISARGDAAGLRLYPGNQLTLGTISISDIHAGAYAKSTDLLLNDENFLPNKKPRACAIDYWTYHDEDDATLTQNVITYDESKISASCLTYMTQCSWGYSKELISNVDQECSQENGNLFDTKDIVESKSVYHAIEATNKDFYVGIISKLETQDETNNDGTSLIPISYTTEKNTFNVPIWIYIIISFIGLLILSIVIYRKSRSAKQNNKLNGSTTNRIPIRNYNTMNNSENVPLVSEQL